MSKARPAIGRLEAIVIDICDMPRAEKFWSAVIGLTFGPSFEPQFRRASISKKLGLSLVLQLVPEKKTKLKNRLHVDIEVGDLEKALKQVEAAGGKLVRLLLNKHGVPFIVCADPNGNELDLV